MLTSMPLIDRRAFIAGAVSLVAAPTVSGRESEMYGLIGKFTAVAGQRDALIAILTASVGSMPGCLSYVVAEDTADPNGIWITEVWDRKESHAASLTLPEVRAAIAQGKPLIAGIGDHVITRPRGGHGLAAVQ
jgi:quinol monooxygenase YgiN